MKDRLVPQGSKVMLELLVSKAQWGAEVKLVQQALQGQKEALELPAGRDPQDREDHRVSSIALIDIEWECVAIPYIH